MQRLDRDFVSRGTRCAAWLYLPDTDAPPPVVVMAHGFAAERTFRLPAFAEKFAAAGLAVLLFDYRGFGDSDGTPRNLVDPMRHLEDWSAAIAQARSLAEVDGRRVALWGSSFSGGHVLSLAARDRELRAIVAQVPYVGGLDLAMPMSIRLHALAAILVDRVAALFGGAYYIPAVGRGDGFGCLMGPEAQEYFAIIPPDSRWQNRVPARALASLASYQPRDTAHQISCPALVVVGTRDATTPADLARDCAACIPRSEVATYECGHFSVYIEPLFATVAERECEFLCRHLEATP